MFLSNFSEPSVTVEDPRYQFAIPIRPRMLSSGSHRRCSKLRSSCGSNVGSINLHLAVVYTADATPPAIPLRQLPPGPTIVLTLRVHEDPTCKYNPRLWNHPVSVRFPPGLPVFYRVIPRASWIMEEYVVPSSPLTAGDVRLLFDSSGRYSNWRKDQAAMPFPDDILEIRAAIEHPGRGYDRYSIDGMSVGYHSCCSAHGPCRIQEPQPVMSRQAETAIFDHDLGLKDCTLGLLEAVMVIADNDDDEARRRCRPTATRPTTPFIPL